MEKKGRMSEEVKVGKKRKIEEISKDGNNENIESENKRVRMYSDDTELMEREKNFFEIVKKAGNTYSFKIPRKLGDQHEVKKQLESEFPIVNIFQSMADSNKPKDEIIRTVDEFKEVVRKNRRFLDNGRFSAVLAIQEIRDFSIRAIDKITILRHSGTCSFCGEKNSATIPWEFMIKPNSRVLILCDDCRAETSTKFCYELLHDDKSFIPDEKKDEKNK